MLVLLIIFMVAAPLMIAGVPVNLPPTAAAKQNPPQKPLVITLTADGKLYIRNEEAAPQEIKERLRHAGGKRRARARFRLDLLPVFPGKQRLGGLCEKFPLEGGNLLHQTPEQGYFQ